MDLAHYKCAIQSIQICGMPPFLMFETDQCAGFYFISYENREQDPTNTLMYQLEQSNVLDRVVSRRKFAVHELLRASYSGTAV